MGIAGLVAFAGIVAAMAAATWRLVQRARSDDAALVPLGWWSVAWVMFTSGCFGVVLEGPMGAVVFWTALGMANATTTDLLAERESNSGAAAGGHESAPALPSAGGSA